MVLVPRSCHRPTTSLLLLLFVCFCLQRPQSIVGEILHFSICRLGYSRRQHATEEVRSDQSAETGQNSTEFGGPARCRSAIIHNVVPTKDFYVRCCHSSTLEDQVLRAKVNYIDRLLDSRHRRRTRAFVSSNATTQTLPVSWAGAA